MTVLHLFIFLTTDGYFQHYVRNIKTDRHVSLAPEPRPSPFTRSVIARARAECNCVWANPCFLIYTHNTQYGFKLLEFVWTEDKIPTPNEAVSCIHINVMPTILCGNVYLCRGDPILRSN